VELLYKRGCQWARTFFGLTSEDKVNIHKILFALSYYSNGGFTFDQVYHMPVYLRTFYMKQLEDAKAKEAELATPPSRPSKR
jgi:hypothetical protein